MRKIEIFDSTLRDGAQGEGISFSVNDKLLIARALDDFGVDYIEAGNPFSNPKDLQFFEELKRRPLRHAKLCAFGSTRRRNTRVEEDANVLSLLQTDTRVVCIFGKSWDLHVQKVLGVSLDENLRMVGDTVSFLKSRGREVIFDAEHWFDGYRNNPAYAMKVLQTAHLAGADALCLCDTNGGSSPAFVGSAISEAASRFSGVRIGIHCHNDIGCAVATSLMAVEAGAVQVQGCFTGIGERCGNAYLSVIIPTLQLKMGFDCIQGDLKQLSAMAAKIMDICNLPVENGRPYVGSSAFAHKAGMHINGVQKVRESFEHIDPELVGNTRRFLMSEVSGRTTVLAKLAAMSPSLTKDSHETALVVQSLKEMEMQGFQFEAAEASFELLILRTLGRYTPHFQLGMYRTSSEYPPPDGDTSASAMLSLQVGEVKETVAAMGNGPVHALDSAMRKALRVFYPHLNEVRLTDYKVRVLSGAGATASVVRVLIESTDGERFWTTVGVSTDIIAASWQALSDSVEYILHKEEGRFEWA